MLDPVRAITTVSSVVAEAEAVASEPEGEMIDASMDTRTASEEKRAARTENQESWRRGERKLFILVNVLIFIWIDNT